MTVAAFTPGTASTLHVLTPAARPLNGSLLDTDTLSNGDLVTDLGGFPPTAHRVVDNALVDITADTLPSRDYWAVARQWLADVTTATGLQDALAIDGYGFWWTLNGQKFVPSLSEYGDVFSWIDLLAALCRDYSPRFLVIHGSHSTIIHLVTQVCPEVKLEVRGAALPSRSSRSLPLHKAGLVAARMFVGSAYLLYSLIRRPDVVVFSATTLMRPAGDGTGLRDVYLGDVTAALRDRGRRTVTVEKHGPNASWRSFRARAFGSGGSYFPNDLVFVFSHPSLQRLGLCRSLFRAWAARWEAVRSRVVPHLTYRGYDLAPVLLPLIAREFRQHAPNLEIMTRAWRRIFRFWRPRLLCVNNSYGRSAVPAVIAAKTLGIPTLEQQHGVMNREHTPYLVPRSAAISSTFPLCDYFAVWGEYFRRLLVDPGSFQAGQVVVTGFPRIDSLLGNLPPRDETLRALTIPPDARVVLYTSNETAAGFRSEILDGLATSTDPNLYWIVKLHPRETARDAWEGGITRRVLERARVVQREIDFYALLAACDIHVSFTSTTLIEAAILGKLNLGLDIVGVPDPVGYAEAGAFLPVAPGEIGYVAERLLNDAGLKQHLAAQQRAFAEDWCLHDGRAVERVVALVETIIEGENLDAGT